MQFLTPFTSLALDEGFGSISHLAVSPQGLLAIGGDEHVVLWDLSPRVIPAQPLGKWRASYRPPLAFSPDGSHLAVGQEDWVAVYAFPANTQRMEHRHDGEISAIAWSPDGAAVASCSERGQYHIWQPATSAMIQHLSFGVAPHFLLWLPDGRVVTNPCVTACPRWPASTMGQVQLWDHALGKVAWMLDDGEKGGDHYTCAALSPTTSVLVLGTTSGLVQLWQVTPGEVPTRSHTIPFHMDSVRGLSWSPDGRYLASGAADGHVVVWDADHDRYFHLGCRHGGKDGVRDVAWWREILAVADAAGHVELYRLPQAKRNNTSRLHQPGIQSWNMVR